MKSVYTGILLGFVLIFTTNLPVKADQPATDSSVIMLVRLYMPRDVLVKLRAEGSDTEADKIYNKYHDEAKEVVNAFNSSFNAFPVYYFWSYNSRKLMEGNNEIVLLDQHLYPEPDVNLSGRNYYIAEFSTSETMAFEALYIRDREFRLMQKPFPYYVRTLSETPFKRSKKRVVEIMNNRIERELNILK